MSQKLYYGRVATVREARNFQRNFAPIISQVLNTAPVEVVDGVKKSCSRKHSKSKELLAPAKLNTIQTDFNKYKIVTQGQKQVESVQLKVAAIATLVKSQENLIVSEPAIVAESIQRIVDAPTVQETNKQIKSAFREIKAQHIKSFVSNVSIAVKESAIAVGFNEVKAVEQNKDLVRIVATNSTGQNLIAEIETGKQIDIRTELIGYTDGSCERVIRAFDNELITRGITAQTKKQKATNGILHMPYVQKKIVKRAFKDESVISDNETYNVITVKQ